MARTAIRRAAVIIAMLGVFAFRPPAQAQAGAPPARIQEIMEKARSGQQLTQEEMKALKDWGRSVGNAMRRPAPSPAARSPADASSSNVSSAPAAGAASSVSKRYDAETSKTEFDGLTIWQRELWPIFSHPRCINCHGVVNPVTGKDHGGGKVKDAVMTDFGSIDDQRPCAQCHTAGTEWIEDIKVFDTAPTPWTLAPKPFLFVGVSSTEVCARMSQDVRVLPDDFFRHFEKDERIKLSFVGLRGMDSRSPSWDIVQPAEPPPVTHEQFLAMLRKWSLIGGGSCGWSGTITYREEVEKNEKLAGPLSGVSREKHEGQTELTVKASRAKGTVHYSDEKTAHSAGQGCMPASEKKTTYSGSATGEGAISVTRNTDGAYHIAFPLFAADQTGQETISMTYKDCPDPGAGFPEKMRPIDRTNTTSRTSRQGKVEIHLKGSVAPSANRITGSMDTTTTNPDGSKSRIVATWDLQTP